MTTMTYGDAIGEALQRIQGVGFEFGPSYANHAPMAAEALARLGYADEVPAWVDRNLRRRRYHDAPEPRWRLDAGNEADWAKALGDFGRVGDWSAMFERELTGRPWRDVLATWWPRLLPGMSGALTHGIIRTAHAVRAMAAGEDPLRRAELARGLGYWAARYAGRPRRVDLPDEPESGALTALDELIAGNAGHYPTVRRRYPVPLIHSITAPAAVRLVCHYLPAEQHWPSYVVASRCGESIRSYFDTPSARQPGAPAGRVEPPTEAELVAAAVELGDEHAIKLAEVAVRQNALAPDERYAAASHAATRQIGRSNS